METAGATTSAQVTAVRIPIVHRSPLAKPVAVINLARLTTA
jgi:hypothetical protein